MSYYHGFELIYEKEIPELNTRARLFRHVKSGAQLLSLENEEENKVFGITFRTPPVDSSGVAHIMEHAVLCGSQKYPVKEPFVELLKGSLNTFLNAMTFPDKTCYPVASQNVQDFYNLIGVYMDAVFHPLISEQAFNQEGWHYELENLDDPLVYKGVVFNEMKGAYSSPESLLGHSVQRSLFPDTTYGVDSGGDPQVIPQLTYAAFKSFHETYYHPANAWIYFFGDDDPDERLRRMDEYLREFDARMVNSEIGLQPAFPEPRREYIPYDAVDEAGGKKSMLAVNWLLPETTDTEQTLGLSILAYILIGTHASPLRKALIDSGLGEDLVGAGLENDLRQMYFSTGLKGIADGDEGASKKINQVEELIWTTLAKLAEEGIDPETVAAALNTVEFRLRENNTGSFPRGLLLMLRCLTTWLYDGDPLAPLAFEAPLQAIKQRLSAGERYFEGLIRQHLLENRHHTTVILQPESGLGARQEQAEQKRLASIRDALSVEELQAILDQTRALKLRQETPDTPEALATIPNLKLTDLDRENKVIPCEVSELSGSRLLYHDLFTNGIAYIDLGMDLHQLPQEYLPYAALFGRVLLEMGTQAEDFVRLSQRIGRTTGGIRPSYFITAVLGEAEQSRTGSAAWLFLRGKATLEHTGDLFAILHDVLLSARLDNPQRFRQMVLEEKADLEAALTPSGHRLVNMRLHSFFGEAGWVNEQMGEQAG
ncbi:MAG: peptidase [Chloroflexi bacterium]|nr:peptidase [Chloroflexota bacterium]